MYNSDIPTRAELPSSAQLLRSTAIAIVAAAGILVTIVLPAEYAIDPTGVGSMLKLTQIGVLLNWRTRFVAIGAKHAAIAFQRSQQHAAGLAFIEEPAGVGRHRFGLPMGAARTGQSRFKLHEDHRVSLSRAGSI